MSERPIDNVKPGSKNSEALVKHLLNLLENSEKRMSTFYHRWAVNEMKYQAYIALPDYEKQWKDMNNAGEPPHPVRFIVPFAFAACSTMTTFCLHTFYGRRPHMQLGVTNTDKIERARKMEDVLQFNADYTRLIRQGYQHFLDISLYGLGIKHIDFVRKSAKRTVVDTIPTFDSEGNALPPRVESRREMRTIYEGNMVTNIDPYMFFPDWRVPMSRVSRDGEFVFIRAYRSKYMLKRDEYHPEHNPDGTYSFVDDIPETTPKNDYPRSSRRTALSRGSAFPGSRDDDLFETGRDPVPGFPQLDQFCGWIVPKQFGLSNSSHLERWIITLANKKVIIQAEPYDADHGQLNVAVSEPFSLGYSFGAPAPIDYIAPIQDVASWLVDSHVENVRAVLNDIFVVDPLSVEMNDLKKSGPGHRIRLRQDAMNRDVRAAIQQLPINDVTAQNLTDLQIVMSLGMMLLGFNENLMGQTQKVSHTTATESRQSAEAGVSRLAAIARLISAESIADMTMQMVLNIQQHISDEFWITMLGSDGRLTPVRVTPDELAAEYQYVIHDGTLPLDRVALVNVWKELTLAVARDQFLSQGFDVFKMFEYTAELSGAKNIEQMRRGTPGVPPPGSTVSVGDEGAIQEEVRKGNLVPVSGGRV